MIFIDSFVLQCVIRCLTVNKRCKVIWKNTYHKQKEYYVRYFYSHSIFSLAFWLVALILQYTQFQMVKWYIRSHTPTFYFPACSCTYLDKCAELAKTKLIRCAWWGSWNVFGIDFDKWMWHSGLLTKMFCLSRQEKLVNLAMVRDIEVWSETDSKTVAQILIHLVHQRREFMPTHCKEKTSLLKKPQNCWQSLQAKHGTFPKLNQQSFSCVWVINSVRCDCLFTGADLEKVRRGSQQQREEWIDGRDLSVAEKKNPVLSHQHLVASPQKKLCAQKLFQLRGLARTDPQRVSKMES